MNYYEHHLGDWAAATSHLTWDEDMAYTRLLRAYYHAERAIPQGQQYRLAKAITPSQRKAVDAVLEEFFQLVEGAYHQKRADDEIARYQDKQRKAKASANARWSQSERNANASPNAMRTHSECNAHQTPDTKPNTPQPPTGGDDPPGFADFWAAWPSSVRKVDRKKCAEKWRRSKFGAISATIIGHVEAMKLTRQWQDGYEPKPLTYLNGERWADGEGPEQVALIGGAAGYV